MCVYSNRRQKLNSVTAVIKFYFEGQWFDRKSFVSSSSSSWRCRTWRSGSLCGSSFILQEKKKKGLLLRLNFPPERNKPADTKPPEPRGRSHKPAADCSSSSAGLRYLRWVDDFLSGPQSRLAGKTTEKSPRPVGLGVSWMRVVVRGWRGCLRERYRWKTIHSIYSYYIRNGVSK